jgi:hypothetical protein
MEHLSEIRNHPVFICGHPKAGTSLLRAVFDSHPQLVVYPEETIFFRRYLPAAQGFDLEGQLALADRLLIHIFRWNPTNPTNDQEGYPDRDYSSISYEQVRKRLHEIARQDYRHPGSILSAAMLAYGEVSGVSLPAVQHWVEKSPYNEYYARQIFDWWPDARCLHILRDPRDNFVSYRRKHPNWEPEFFAANWIRSTAAGLGNLDRFGSERYCLLRYEDLTQEPKVYLEKVKDFLQIDWDASFYSPTRAGEKWQGNSMFADRFQEISAAPVARWKEKLTPQETAIIELKAGKMMERSDYTPQVFQGMSTSDQVAVRWRLFTFPIRRMLGVQTSEKRQKKSF